MAIYDKSRGGYRVFIGDLGPRVSKYDLEQEMSYTGEIIDVWVARNPPGFAFVVYKYPEDADKAVSKLHGRTVCGRRVRVEHAVPFGEERRPRQRSPPRRWSPRRSSPRRRRSSSRERSRRSRSRGKRSRSRSRSRNRDRRSPRSSSKRYDSRSPGHSPRRRSRSPDQKSRSPSPRKDSLSRDSPPPAKRQNSEQAEDHYSPNGQDRRSSTEAN